MWFTKCMKLFHIDPIRKHNQSSEIFRPAKNKIITFILVSRYLVSAAGKNRFSPAEVVYKSHLKIHSVHLIKY